MGQKKEDTATWQETIADIAEQLKKSMGREEIVRALHEAWNKGFERFQLKVINNQELSGWTLAIAHLARELSVSKDWIHCCTDAARLAIDAYYGEAVRESPDL